MAERKTGQTKTAKVAPKRKRTVKRKATKADAAPSPQKPARKTTSQKQKPTAKKANPPHQQEPQPIDLPVYDDMARFATYMADINIRAQQMMQNVADQQASLGRKVTENPADPLNVSEAGAEVAQALTAHPMKLIEMQMGLWEDYARLFQSVSERMAGVEAEPVVAPPAGDRRFRHKAWNENPMLDFIKQSYLILSQWVDKAIVEAEGVDAPTRRRAQFHADQLLSALSPTNVPTLNPEVIDETIATKGANWLAGMQNFIEDMERGRGELAIKQADLDYFKVGENIATTPGKVVYQNELMQLIQYAPTTEKVAERPMIIFPPWINKFYILDLQPENSFVRWLVEQGRTVFVVSWVNPDTKLKDKSFPDYMREGVFEALEAVHRATGSQSVDTIGYCIGGTLLATTLAYMAHIGDDRIASATFFTAQTDFSEAGDLLLFVDEKQLKTLERQIDATGGLLEGSAMARTFNMLRPNDLIWSAFVDNYYKGKEAKKFDLLYWNSDSTRMTKACHLFYLREFYLNNSLAKGALEIEGVPIHLGSVKIPIFMQAGETDHIAPFNSIYKSAKMFGGDVEYMLAGSGHIAGVINHPDKKKYHYRTNKQLPETFDKWAEGATNHDYSWWPYWIKWLDEQSPGQVKARIPGDGELKPIEDAPGSYVRVRAD